MGTEGLLFWSPAISGVKFKSDPCTTNEEESIGLIVHELELRETNESLKCNKVTILF